MLYKLFYSLYEIYSPFNVFRYITFRTALAAITAMVITFMMAPWLIKQLKKYNLTQRVRHDGPKTHYYKSNTPTMGGIIIILSILISVVMWGDLSNKYVLIMIAAISGFGMIGLMDDYLKAVRQNSKGLHQQFQISRF